MLTLSENKILMKYFIDPYKINVKSDESTFTFI